MGLHRKQPLSLENSLKYEFCKRLFWSFYSYDRLLSSSLGRPFNIPDSDIDVPLPLNLDLELNDKRKVFELQILQDKNPVLKESVSPFTALVETCKVRQIESRSHLSLFSVNKSMRTTETFESLSADLETWRESLPSRSEIKRAGNESYDYFNLMYNRAMLILMLPRITSSLLTSVERSELLEKASIAAGGIAQAYKSLYKDNILGYSRYALHTVFLAGVSLVYYLWNHNQKNLTSNTHSELTGNTPSDLRACTSLLFVFAERWPEARSYRDVFENLVENQASCDQRKAFDFNQLLNQFVNNKENNGKISETFTFDDNFWENIDKMGESYNLFSFQ